MNNSVTPYIYTNLENMPGWKFWVGKRHMFGERRRMVTPPYINV